jgi:AbrB family looped-hinge helix DNA binding protein
MQDENHPTRIIRSLRSGQITIPAEFRKRLGIRDDSLLQVSLHGDELRLKPVRVPQTLEGSPWLRELYDFFAPVREEAAAYTEEEVDQAIDEALAAVRKRRD